MSLYSKTTQIGTSNPMNNSQQKNGTCFICGSIGLEERPPEGPVVSQGNCGLKELFSLGFLCLIWSKSWTRNPEWVSFP